MWDKCSSTEERGVCECFKRFPLAFLAVKGQDETDGRELKTKAVFYDVMNFIHNRVPVPVPFPKALRYPFSTSHKALCSTLLTHSDNRKHMGCSKR